MAMEGKTLRKGRFKVETGVSMPILPCVCVCEEYGPNVKYSVSPPTMLVSRKGTISSRVTLVLTPSNAASLFACVASHPTFVGEVGRQTVQFMLPNDAHQAHAQGSPFSLFVCAN